MITLPIFQGRILSNPLTTAASGDEERRLGALQEYDLVDTLPEREFDSIAALAARALNAPVGLISLVGRDRIFFKARYGTDLCETTRELSFCAQALLVPDLLVVLDATKDARFAASPLVTGAPGIRFYAGAPLVGSGGPAVGTLCVIDFKPRDAMNESDRQLLRDLAMLVMQHMERRRAQRDRYEAERQFRLLVNGVKDCALYMLDPSGIVVSWNAGAQQINGYTTKEIVGQHYSRFYTDEDRESGAPERALRLAAEQGRFETDAWRTRKDGSLFWANVLIQPIYDDGTLVGFAKITRDITERRNNEERLRCLAHVDALTGLPNRYSFLTRLGELINQTPAALLVLDLDRFKEVNDTLGHQAGDFLLKSVGNRIEATLAGNGAAARLGGDEFAVILPKLTSPIEAAEVSEAIIRAFRAPFVWEGQEIHVGLSIGIAISPNHGSSVEELLASADLALYDAKSQRRTGYSLFRESFRQAVLGRRSCEQELRRAVAKGELELHYQPQVRLSDRRVVGAEALLRWNHPEKGLLSPRTYLHVLDRSPLAPQVGHWIIRSACGFAAGMRSQGHDHFCVAVNLFGAQLRSGNLVSVVSAALAEHQLSPNALELEITENVILEHDEAAVATLRELAQLGVRAAFDDYGTGYASLSLLKRFPITRLKIDQSFVRDICTDPEDAAVVKAILYLGQSFGLGVLAEGVEREDQEEMLRKLGCLYGQGYLYAKPMTAPEMQAVLARERAHGNDILSARSA